MPEIHPSAVVDPSAELGEDVVVGPLCYVGPKVTLGRGTRLIANVTVIGRSTLGEDNTLWPTCVIGADPQDLKFEGEDSEVRIGDCNEFREGVTIHKGTANDEGLTRLGDHNLVMAYTHVAHDCILGNRNVIANSVQFAGHCVVEDHVTVGGLSAIHHFTTLGRHSFVGGMTRVVADVPPFMILDGSPSEVRGLNIVGLRRRGFTDESVRNLKDAYRRLFGARLQTGVGKTADALRALDDAYPHDPHILELCAFIRRSEDVGRFGRYREGLRGDNRWTNKPK